MDKYIIEIYRNSFKYITMKITDLETSKVVSGTGISEIKLKKKLLSELNNTTNTIRN